MTVFEPRRPLRPLGPVRVVGGSVGIFFGRLAAMVATAIVILAGAVLAVGAVLVPVVLAVRTLPPVMADPAAGQEGIVLAALTGLLAALAVPFLVLWLAAGAGALLAVMGAGALGRPMGVAAAFGVGMRRALALLGATIASRLVVAFFALPGAFLMATSAFLLQRGAVLGDPVIQALAAPFLCVVPLLVLVAIFVSLRLVFVPFAAVYEDHGPIGSIERSWALTRGQVLRLFGYTFLVAALAVLLSTVAGFAVGLLTPSEGTVTLVPGGFFPGGNFVLPDGTRVPAAAVLAGALSLVLSLVIAAIAQIVFVVLYFDTRLRLEGFGAVVDEPVLPPPWPGTPVAAAPGMSEPATSGEVGEDVDFGTAEPFQAAPEATTVMPPPPPAPAEPPAWASLPIDEPGPLEADGGSDTSDDSGGRGDGEEPGGERGGAGSIGA